jgi:hypothetical protein
MNTVALAPGFTDVGTVVEPAPAAGLVVDVEDADGGAVLELDPPATVVLAAAVPAAVEATVVVVFRFLTVVGVFFLTDVGVFVAFVCAEVGGTTATDIREETIVNDRTPSPRRVIVLNVTANLGKSIL